MKLWRWHLGRQGGGYDKFPLWVSERFKFDAYLLRFPEGSEVKEHTDPAPAGYGHHRLNVILRKPREGGEIGVGSRNAHVLKEGQTYTWAIHDISFRRVMKFRPDIQTHYMRPILKGSMLMLSIGWLKKEKQ